MKLNKLIDTPLDLDISSITTYSKNARGGSLFLCIKGSNTDRHLFIEDAASRGAVAAIIDDKKYQNSPIPTILVDNVNSIYDSLIAKFYGNPEKRIKLIALTGTDGKTTTAAMVEQMLGSDICCNFGTNGAFFADKHFELNNTTPDSEVFYPLLKQFADNGAEYAVIEFSSEAEHFRRLRNLQFDIIALTNITSDHLNTHKTLENYIDAKLSIFKNHLKKSGTAILNSSCEQFELFKNSLANKAVKSFGYKNADNWKIDKIVPKNTGFEVELIANEKAYNTKLKMFGKYNVYNYILSTAIVDTLSKDYLQTAKSAFAFSIPGRMNMFITSSHFTVIIDYAHTFNSINSILDTAKEKTRGKIIVVTGAAGDRDKSKRPKIARLLEEKADQIIFTTDDPHFENNDQIIQDLMSGITNKNVVDIEIDRGKAIEKAISEASKGDTILILGKGDDKYIISGGEKIPFCDTEFTKSVFSKLNISYT
ncbi:MAG: UDP-N-acetylmuramoyl-L-alanyl-D-glutamate--2,6-diaminopimelate ligase [Bifidobacteriaceae bacterium]|jgi:UDP-N-acetylmuramoyl-L-alanyl-D-glutamate--2,6-diaminopimelate ligase|nr:UDP-N-acetylmuramoyl-L-alanyl-D-glutamate--2,6-diaminopimelate ligase [Bifidobacteriaceae bacterium]